MRKPEKGNFLAIKLQINTPPIPMSLPHLLFLVVLMCCLLPTLEGLYTNSCSILSSHLLLSHPHPPHNKP